MLTIKNDQADAFVRAPPADVRAFLVQGPDEGLVSERARFLISAVKARAGADASVIRIEGDKLAADPDAYVSDLYGASLFGGARILTVRAGGRDIAGALEPVLKAPADDAYLIVEAANLRKDREGPLRAAFATGRQTVAIDCYPDDRASLGRLIEDEARQRGAEVTAEARAALLDMLGPDRLANRLELEKLFLYGLSANRIGLEDVEAIVAGQDDVTLEEVLDVLLSGEPKTVAETLNAFSADASDLQGFAFRLVTRLLILLGLAEAMAQGEPFAQALRDLGAWVPSKSQPALQRQAQRWRPAALRRLVPILFRYLARSRQQGKLAGVLLERFLWNLTTSAR